MIKHLCVLLFAFAAFYQFAAAVEVPLEIDKEHSRIEVDVKGTAASFLVKLESYESTISVDSATNRVVYTQLRFRFTDFKTGVPRRDLEMRDWQSTEQFPECVYWMTSIEGAPDGKLIARGKLVFHGQTRNLACPIRVKSDEKKIYTIEGEIDVDTRDYGLPIFRKFGILKVDPIVKVRFHLQGNLARSRMVSL